MGKGREGGKEKRGGEKRGSSFLKPSLSTSFPGSLFYTTGSKGTRLPSLFLALFP